MRGEGTSSDIQNSLYDTHKLGVQVFYYYQHNFAGEPTPNSVCL